MGGDHHGISNSGQRWKKFVDWCCDFEYVKTAWVLVESRAGATGGNTTEVVEWGSRRSSALKCVSVPIRWYRALSVYPLSVFICKLLEAPACWPMNFITDCCVSSFSLEHKKCFFLAWYHCAILNNCLISVAWGIWCPRKRILELGPDPLREDADKEKVWASMQVCNFCTFSSEPNFAA